MRFGLGILLIVLSSNTSVGLRDSLAVVQPVDINSRFPISSDECNTQFVFYETKHQYCNILQALNKYKKYWKKLANIKKKKTDKNKNKTS